MEFREATMRDIEQAADASVSRSFKQAGEQTDFVYTLEHEGQVLGVGGIKIMTPTTAWCWMDWTQASRQHTKTIYRTAKEWLAKLMADKGLQRVMAAVEVDFPQAHRTVEHMGFTRESVMPRFFGERDAILFVKFAEK